MFYSSSFIVKLCNFSRVCLNSYCVCMANEWNNHAILILIPGNGAGDAQFCDLWGGRGMVHSFMYGQGYLFTQNTHTHMVPCNFHISKGDNIQRQLYNFFMLIFHVALFFSPKCKDFLCRQLNILFPYLSCWLALENWLGSLLYIFVR